MRLKLPYLIVLWSFILFHFGGVRFGQSSVHHRELSRNQLPMTSSLRTTSNFDEDLQLHQQRKKVKRSKDPEKMNQRLQKLRIANLQAQSKLENTYHLNFQHKINQTFSYINSGVPAISMTEKELNGKAKCSFVGASCPTEAIEHQLVRNYLESTDTVLEFGGRFGTTSCEIAKMQKNSGKLVTVEPDHNVWYLLALNRYTHHCNFWIYRGTVSEKKMVLSQGSYDTRTLPTSKVPDLDSKDSMTLSELRSHLNLSFNALLIDCEGCIEYLFHQDQPELLRKELQPIETIILEADMSDRSPSCTSNCVDYNKWLKLFQRNGFQLTYQKLDAEFPDINHYVFSKKKGGQTLKTGN